MSDEDRLVTLESELAECRRKLALVTKCNTCGGDGKTTHGGPCICGGSGRAEDELQNMRMEYLVVREAVDRFARDLDTRHLLHMVVHVENVRDASQRFAQLVTELKEETRRREAAEAKLRVVATDVEGVWRWQGGGDEPQSLSCPVVMSADTLRALIGHEQYKEIAAYMRGGEWKQEAHPFHRLDTAMSASPNDLVRWLADRIEAKWEGRESSVMTGAKHERRDSLVRCQQREKDEQCALPVGHLCDCLYLGPPLTMLQGLSWAEEQRKTVARERGIALAELKRRADWLKEECLKGGTCFAERDQAYVAVQTLERLYGAKRERGER